MAGPFAPSVGENFVKLAAQPTGPQFATPLEALAEHFAEGNRYPGWVECGWSRPTGAALEAVVETLKAMKLTIRNTPLGAAVPGGACVFTGEAAVETIYVARAY